MCVRMCVCEDVSSARLELVDKAGDCGYRDNWFL